MLGGIKNLVAGSKGPKLAIIGFFLGLLLTILGYLPAVIGGIVLMVKIMKAVPGI